MTSYKQAKILQMEALQICKDNILQFINKESVIARQTKIQKIAIENQKLIQAHTNTFIFKGIWYTGGDDLRRTDKNKYLHYSLRSAMDKLINKSSMSYDNYINQILLLSNSREDISKLIHPQIFENMPLMYLNLFDNNGESLVSENAIKNFRNKFKEEINKLNILFLTRLVLQKN